MNCATHILVVDDNPAMTKTLADILKYKGYTVYAAYSGMEALEILQDHVIDILLTDVRMPDINGVDLYRETRKTHPHLHALLMTAYATEEIIQQGLMEGIKKVFTKPLDIGVLLAQLSTTFNNNACKS